MTGFEKATCGTQSTTQEAAAALTILRSLCSEDQRIAFALLQGMLLQKRIDEQRSGDSCTN